MDSFVLPAIFLALAAACAACVACVVGAYYQHQRGDPGAK
jgi:hypothetical protein